jgi:putative PIN family toxin of toxin-antitoxin system
MKVVLDSNVLLVAIGRKSRFRPIWDKFIEGQYQLIVSEEVLHEYEEILKQRSAPGVAELVSDIFIESPDIIYTRVYYFWNAITQDPDDNKFFDVAAAANADFLVTNDAHFNEAAKIPFPHINIISSEAFLELIQKTNEIDFDSY